MATATDRKQQLRDQRVAAGLCPDCGERPPADERTRCAECLSAQCFYNEEHRKRLKQKKMCVCCGQEKAERGSRYGKACRDRFRAYQRGYAAETRKRKPR